MSKQLAIITFFSFLISLSSNNWADTQRSVSISVPPFPPFISISKSTKCSGVIEDLIKNIGLDSNITFQLINTPYARIIHHLQHGALDSALIFKNQQLLTSSDEFESLDYIGPISLSEVIIISRAELSNYQDIQQLKAVATIRKAHFDQRFDNDKAIDNVYVENYQQGLKMFQVGRADAIIGSKIGLADAIEKLQMNPELIDNAYSLSHQEWGLHILKGRISNAKLALLNRVVKATYQQDLVYRMYLEKLKLQRNCFI